DVGGGVDAAGRQKQVALLRRAADTVGHSVAVRMRTVVLVIFFLFFLELVVVRRTVNFGAESPGKEHVFCQRFVFAGEPRRRAGRRSGAPARRPAWCPWVSGRGLCYSQRRTPRAPPGWLFASS